MVSIASSVSPWIPEDDLLLKNSVEEEETERETMAPLLSVADPNEGERESFVGGYGAGRTTRIRWCDAVLVAARLADDEEGAGMAPLLFVEDPNEGERESFADGYGARRTTRLRWCDAVLVAARLADYEEGAGMA